MASLSSHPSTPAPARARGAVGRSSTGPHHGALSASDLSAERCIGSCSRAVMARDLENALRGRMRLNPREVSELAAAAGLELPAFLEALLKPAATMAVTPISNFKVGAAALGVSGAVFLGVNLEFPGLPLSQSVHAEQFAVCNATLAGERGISTIAVNEAPCGHCRQFMCELPSAGELTVAGGNRPTHTLAELLPDRFGPEALLHDDGSHRIMTNDPVELRLTADSSAELEALRGESQGPLAAVAEAALAQAKRSYTPYTNSQAGLSLGIPAAGDDPVLVVAGAALESAAYNPTLPPFQAAAIALRVAGGWDRLKDVAECVLVERRDAPTSHAAITRAAIETVAPKARFTHLWAEV